MSSVTSAPLALRNRPHLSMPSSVRCPDFFVNQSLHACDSCARAQSGSTLDVQALRFAICAVAHNHQRDGTFERPIGWRVEPSKRQTGLFAWRCGCAVTWAQRVALGRECLGGDSGSGDRRSSSSGRVSPEPLEGCTRRCLCGGIWQAGNSRNLGKREETSKVYTS